MASALTPIETWIVTGEKTHTNTKVDKKTGLTTTETTRETKEFSKKAESAKDKDINPEEVAKAISKLKSTTSSSISSIVSSLESISAGAGRDALSVQDATMAPAISQAGSQLNSVTSMISSACEEVQTLANTEHNKRQKEYNENAHKDAESKCKSAGYTKISERCTTSS